MKFRIAYDVIAHILGIYQVPGKDNIYMTKDHKKRYIRTKWGFEPVEKHNLKIRNMYLEREIDKLKKQNEELYYDYESAVKKAEGLRKQLELCYENTRKLKHEKGFVNKLLKEMLDKNLAYDKKYERLLKSKENLDKQLENLKSSKANLLEQYNALVEKNRDQKKHLQEFQKVIADLKKK